MANNHQAAQKVLEAQDLLRQALVALEDAKKVARGNTAQPLLALLLRDVEQARSDCRSFAYTVDFNPIAASVVTA